MSPASPANGALMQPTRTSNPNANKLDRTSRKKFSRLVAGIIPAILIVFLYVSALGLAGCAVTAGPGAGNTGAFKLTTDSLPAGHAGKAYFSTLAVAGGIAPFSWSVSAGSLPAGVTLGTGNGALVGTPSKAGSYSVTITVSDSTKQISRKTFSIDVASSASPLSIDSTPIPDGQVGSAYSAALGVSGGTAPYTWSISSGALPGGLSLGQSNGVISGTPTTSGQFTFTAMVTDSTSPTPQTATQSFSFTIAAASSQPPSITTTSLPGGTTGSAYSATLGATGGTIPYTWSISAGTLPAGLNLVASSGLISGTPASAGNSSFTVRVKDAKNNTATKTLSISIAASGPQPLGITTTALPQASTAAAYNVTLQATGGTPGYTWAITSGQLPAGLAFMASSGTITGTATTVGQSNFTVQVTDSASTPATASQPLSITVVKSVPLDQYGGRTDIPCAQATGWFHTEQINTRWWLCTPVGNAFFLQGVGAWQTPILPKYGNSQNAAAAALINEFQSWNFNAVGELSYGPVEPIISCPGCTKLPEIQTLTVSNYAAANLWNYAQHPMKNLKWGLNNNYTGWRASFMDFFEPQFGTWLDGYFANDRGFLSYKASPYFVGIMLDDTDWFWGMGAGPDFHTYPVVGHTNSHVGLMMLITSPVQSFNPDPASRGIPELYADPKVYSKTGMASPPASCSALTPCSLRDYLFIKYNGSISALNGAWGSNYTTFDSTGAQVTGEVIATGNGSTTVFNATLRHAPVSPESVVIKVGGTPAGGDCPAFTGTCNVTTGGSLSGPAGTTIATGKQAWLSNIYGRAGVNLPALSMWAIVAYHFPGGSGQIAVPSRQVGQNFSAGGTQGFVISPLDQTGGLATGYDVYVSCRVNSISAPALGCAGANTSQPAESLQATNVPFGTDWGFPLAGLISGASVPAPPSTISYSNGAITITFATPPAAGQQVTLDYVSNGWMYGTGLMDEDGRNTTWVGTNAVCLTPALACDGKDNPLPNANPNLGADLDAWVAQFAGEYFGTLNNHLKAAAPHMLYFGADTVGTWGAPPRKEILQGATPYVDGLFTQWYGNLPDQATAGEMYSFLTQNFGKPLINFMTLNAQPDSALFGFAAGSGPTLAVQPLRGQQWSATTSALLNTPSFNNTYQWIGNVWWGSHDFLNEETDWGLKTPSDNAYDGHESVTGSVSCSPPLQSFKCGGEARNYGDLVTGVKAANQLWLTIP